MKEKLSVGLDIGGTKSLLGVVNSQGEIIDSVYMKTCSNANEAAKKLSGVFKEYDSKYKIQKKLNIALAGFISSQNQVLKTPNLNDSYKEIGGRLRDLLGVEITLVNDANAAAWCEFKYGNYIDNAQDIVTVTLGTGIGGGIVTNGTLYTGAFGLAAEIGHMQIDSSEKASQCKCGKYGCWENYASGTALTNQLEKIGYKTESGKHKFSVELLERQEMKDLLHKYAHYVAIGLSNIDRILNPKLIIIGGGISRIPNLINDFVIPAYDALAYNNHYHATIANSYFRGTASLIGAATLNCPD